MSLPKVVIITQSPLPSLDPVVLKIDSSKGLLNVIRRYSRSRLHIRSLVLLISDSRLFLSNSRWFSKNFFSVISLPAIQIPQILLSVHTGERVKSIQILPSSGL